VGYIFGSAALTGPGSVWQLARHVLWRISVSVEGDLLESKLDPRAFTPNVAQPPECTYESGNGLFSYGPKWPVDVRLRPPKVICIACGPSDAIIRSLSWWIAGFIAGLYVSCDSELWKFRFQIEKSCQLD